MRMEIGIFERRKEWRDREKKRMEGLKKSGKNEDGDRNI
jgi:hypothetical protein